MRVWRICKAEHATTAFTGEGALLYPGRWHHAGTPVVYCSESRALAALEQLVHLHRNRLPPSFVCFGVEIPEDLEIREVQTQELPAEWHRQPGPPELRDIGTHWAESGETAVLQVPSAVVPDEHNFLLNPRHPEFVRLTIGGSEPFAFDERLVEPSRDAGAQRDGLNREGSQGTTWSREQTRTSRYSGGCHVWPPSGSAKPYTSRNLSRPMS